ncbi:MAG: Cation diffusion facilitator family transporter, partial [Hyphomicrobiales bacterium]|nr:Cation diffusion facilitator family transporter [Hyphomicrobiales bacterium]
IAARRRLAVHHITIQHVAGKVSISLDLELDAQMQHGDAHDIATALEESISAEVGEEIEIETHIEPLEAEELAGEDLPEHATADIKRLLIEGADQGGIVKDVHFVRARQTSSGLVVNYHCRVDPTLSVHDVHEAVDQLDRRLRARMEGVVRVVGHADPLPR